MLVWKFDSDDAGGDWAGRLVTRMVQPFELTAAPLARAHRFELGEGRWRSRSSSSTRSAMAARDSGS
jgi:hypothetical protein